MNPEAIQQIVETIKTLNLNIDSQTAIEIVQILKPLMWLYILKGFVLSFLGLVAFVFAIYLISKAVKSYYKNKE